MNKLHLILMLIIFAFAANAQADEVNVEDIENISMQVVDEDEGDGPKPFRMLTLPEQASPMAHEKAMNGTNGLNRANEARMEHQPSEAVFDHGNSADVQDVKDQAKENSSQAKQAAQQQAAEAREAAKENAQQAKEENANKRKNK